ncbi:SAM-dependent methyltransferase [Streptomyces sp. NBC_00825]|uniref:N-6 DNA methylase n=1 Tax=unclassified Streptomyces TaxID=2593676 RepID=UPI002ED03C1A|nr:SAM-dependent methyltransferase [Streptomyces sp. NBC_00826]WTH94264.1 SAM-dependent methyltransferase [Streptomyces sp. NBC_00825]WTI02999.1 SAM-dependent methyltransferase [Streptomyces sp. NBC_00822]
MQQLDLFAQLDDEPQPPKPNKVIALPKPTAGQWAATPPKQSAGTAPRSERRRSPEFVSRPTDGPTFGEKVSYAWHNAHGGNRMEIPLGIVATLALWPQKEYPRTFAAFFRTLDAESLLQCVREVAAYWWMRRPDLIDTASPLFKWAEEEHTAHELHAIRATFHAALDAHALDHTGHIDPEWNSNIDLMSWTITNLRHNAARQGLGEYHTPPEICDLMAAQTIGRDPDEIPDDCSLLDPCAGTGGMFRSAAQHVRSMGLDPAKYTWFAQEIDPLAAAGCAVNIIVWGLGTKAMIACGDTLAEGDLWPRAIKHRRAMVEHRDDVQARMAIAYALGRSQQLLDLATKAA